MSFNYKLVNSQDIRNELEKCEIELEQGQSTTTTTSSNTVDIPRVIENDDDDKQLEDAFEEDVIIVPDDDVGFAALNDKSTGRKRDPIWKEFNTTREEEKITSNICRHCSMTVGKQPCRMKAHLVRCKPYLQKTNVTMNTETKEVKEKVQSLNFTQPKISGFVKTTAPGRQEKLHQLLGKFIFSSNSSFNLVENQEFQTFVKELNPSYKLPSHDVVGSTLLNLEYEDIVKKIKAQLNGQKVTLSQDGWSTLSQEPVIAHSVVCKGRPYFLHAKSTGTNAKTAEYCAELMRSVILDLTENYNCKVIGIITDNCSTMISLQRKIKETDPCCHVYGCNAHLFNLVGQEFTNNELLKKVVDVQKFFRNHYYTAGELKQLGEKRAVLPCSTRWNSQTDCCISFLKNHSSYMEIIRQRRNVESRTKNEREEEAKIFEILSDNEHYDDVQRMVNLSQSVVKAIDYLQRDGSTVADACAQWINVRDSIALKFQSSKYFLEKMRLGMTETSIAAYMLHPKYKGLDLSEEEKEMGRKCFEKKSPLYIVTVMELMANDSSIFPETMLLESVTSKMNPVTWWKSIDQSRLPVGFIEFAEDLLNLPSSTASLERDFSALANIMTKKRNRIGIEKASKLCYVHQSLHSELNSQNKGKKRKWFEIDD